MARTFTDSAGRDWSVTFDVPTAKRIRRSSLGVDLLSANEQETPGLQNVIGDMVLFIDVLWIICEKQAVVRGVSQDDFGAVMLGDTISKAVDAFTEAYFDFFPPGKRENLRRALAKLTEAGTLLTTRLCEKLENVNVSDLVDAQMRRMFPEPSTPTPSGGASTNAPASSESIPMPMEALGPSGNSSGQPMPELLPNGSAQAP